MNPPNQPVSLAREMWEVSERYHQVCYMAPEVRHEGTEAGLKGFWMNYFATRAAPMGAVTPATVEAVFFYYSPKRVYRALPDAWRFSDPETVLAARYRAMDAALRRELGARLGQSTTQAALAEAVDLHRQSLAHTDVLAKPLFAAWADLEWPTEPHLALWHATTLQREYRNGCHLIALGASGLDGCESVLSQVAVDQAPKVWITDEAAWTEEEAGAARRRLIDRGWLEPDGAATSLGRSERARIEALTDDLDAQRWNHLGASGCERLKTLMTDLTTGFPADDQLDWEQIYGPNQP